MRQGFPDPNSTVPRISRRPLGFEYCLCWSCFLCTTPSADLRYWPTQRQTTPSPQPAKPSAVIAATADGEIRSSVCLVYRVIMAMMDEHRLSSRRTAEIIRRELERGDLDFAFRVMATAIADFRQTSPSNHGDFLIPAGSTGSLRWDTLLAAVIGRECERLGIPKPP